MDHIIVDSGVAHDPRTGQAIGGAIGSWKCSCGEVSRVWYGNRSARVRSHADHARNATDDSRALRPLPEPTTEADRLTAVLLGHLAAVGADSLPSQLAKLREETAEWEEAWEIEELADVVVVACTAAAIQGYSVPQLLELVYAKMRINAGRTWGREGEVGKHQ